MTGIFVFYIVTLETELEILGCAISCIYSNYSLILLIATVHCCLQYWLLLQHMQTLVYGGQAAFDAIVQTLEARYARTDNSLRMIHLSVCIPTDK